MGPGSLEDPRLDQWALKQMFDSQGEFPVPGLVFLVTVQVTKHSTLREAEGTGLKALGWAERDLLPSCAIVT